MQFKQSKYINIYEIILNLKHIQKVNCINQYLDYLYQLPKSNYHKVDSIFLSQYLYILIYFTYSHILPSIFSHLLHTIIILIFIYYIMGTQTTKDISILNDQAIAAQLSLNYDQAIQYYHIILNLPQQNTSNLAIVLNNIGLSYSGKKQYDTAIKYYKQSIQVYSKLNGDDNFHIITVYNNLGNAYMILKRYTESLRIYKSIIQIIIKFQKTPYQILANTYNAIGLIYQYKKQYQKSMDHFKISLEIKQSLPQRDKQSIATAYYNIANLYYSLQKYAQAIQNYQKILHLLQQSQFIIKVIIAIANSYDQNNLPQKALQYYQKALEIDCKIYPQHNLNTGKILESIGFMYQKKQDWKNGYKYHFRAYCIRYLLFGPDNVQTINSTDDLKRCQNNIYFGFEK